MKRFFTISFLLLFSTFLFGTTYHTISIDGTNDFDSATEQFTTTSTGYTAYITWDQNNLYIGYDGSDVGSGSSTKWVLVYIDTDPQLNPTTGTGTTVGQLYNTQQPNLPFTANYHLRWKADNTYTNMEKWNGSSWDPGTGGYWTGSAYQSGNFVEISIPLSDLDNPTQIYICTNMINEASGGEWTYAGNPNDMFGDGYNPNYSHYYGYNLTSGVSPNQTQYHDQSLPVTLSSFSAQIKSTSFVLQWTTQSEINVLGYEIQRALDKEGPFATIATYRNHDELRATGNTSGRTDYQFEDKNVLSGVTYWYKLISHDLDGSQQSFGPIAATLQSDEQNFKPISGNTPEEFRLEQNFPNPFNNSTAIQFSIPQLPEGSAAVKLNIYDITGKLVNTLVDQELGTGSYQVNWNGTDFQGNVVTSGVYVYQLKSGQFIFSRKMLLVQ